MNKQLFFTRPRYRNKLIYRIRIIFSISLIFLFFLTNISSGSNHSIQNKEVNENSKAPDSNCKASFKIAVFPSYLRLGSYRYTAYNAINRINKKLVNDLNLLELKYVINRSSDFPNLDKPIIRGLNHIWKFRNFNKVPDIDLIIDLGKRLNLDAAIVYRIANSSEDIKAQGFLIDIKTEKVYQSDYKQTKADGLLSTTLLDRIVYNVTTRNIYKYLGFKDTTCYISEFVQNETQKTTHEEIYCTVEDKTKHINKKIKQKKLALFPFYGTDGSMVSSDPQIVSSASGFPFSHILEKEYVDIKGSEYKQAITLDPDLSEVIQIFFKKKGYKYSDCLLIKAMFRLMTAKKTSIEICYFEDLSTHPDLRMICGNPDKITHLLQSEQQVLKQFKARSNRCFN